MLRERLRQFVPSWQSLLLSLAAAMLLILAFPDFELWYLAWFALVPLLFAVEREKASAVRSFVAGWVFGLVFFFGTCWWLTFAPITYAGFPPALAYFLLFCLCSLVAVFPGIFAAVMAVLLRRLGPVAMLAAPFIWVFTEFLRYWLTGNNWNALGYSQAFNTIALEFAQVGGALLVSAVVTVPSAVVVFVFAGYNRFMHDPEKAPYFTLFAHHILGPVMQFDPRIRNEMTKAPEVDLRLVIVAATFIPIILYVSYNFALVHEGLPTADRPAALVIAIQPSVPMSGLNYEKWNQLRNRHVALATSAKAPPVEPFVDRAIAHTPSDSTEEERQILTEYYTKWIAEMPRVVIFPESPMNFMYEDDPETKAFINGFAAKNNVSVLFNSAEPNHADGKFYNSAVLVSPEGREVAQYDKIYLLPFGEAVPVPFESIVPAFVGSFSYGKEYDLLPLGEAKAGVMICFESHFGQLSREYVRNGADAIIEMTNDGYLGNTPVLRQHLANAVFRAVETNRPVLRVTNVGITAYINERGEVMDPAPVYQEDTRVWAVSKSDGSQTFYVKYGDWFAWLCSVVTLGLLVFAWRKPQES